MQKSKKGIDRLYNTREDITEQIQEQCRWCNFSIDIIKSNTAINVERSFVYFNVGLPLCSL